MHIPIRFHLDGQRFDPETIRVMGLAYEMALIALRLTDRGDIANDVVAHKIIERAKAGDRDPEQLCEAVLKQWRPTPAPRGPSFRGTVVEVAHIPSVPEKFGSKNYAAVMCGWLGGRRTVGTPARPARKRSSSPGKIWSRRSMRPASISRQRSSVSEVEGSPSWMTSLFLHELTLSLADSAVPLSTRLIR